VEDFWGGLSTTLYAELPHGGGVAKPFIKGSVRHRFDYSNEVFVPSQIANGVAFGTQTIAFDDDDTAWGAETGIEYAVERAEYSGSIFYEGSGDFDAIGGRLGAKFRLN
jgi:outer membrane autotransporter protein